MKLEITQVLYLDVEEDWYDPDMLSGVGTKEEQICEYEKSNIEDERLCLDELDKGETTVRIADGGTEKEESSIQEQEER